jgi:ubiquinone biosynthesis protein COQ9
VEVTVNVGEKRQACLQSVLRDSQFEGWNDAVVLRSGRDIGISELDVKLLFPNLASDVATYFSAQADLAMNLADDRASSLSVRKKIALLIKKRLTWLAPYREAVSQVLKFYALPANWENYLSGRWNTADLVWHIAGDKATDHNHYIKRLSLILVHCATLMYWLHDYSPNYIDSWQFLNNRIDDILILGKLKSLFKSDRCCGVVHGLNTREN